MNQLVRITLFFVFCIPCGGAPAGNVASPPRSIIKRYSEMLKSGRKARLVRLLGGAALAAGVVYGGRRLLGKSTVKNQNFVASDGGTSSTVERALAPHVGSPGLYPAASSIAVDEPAELALLAAAKETPAVEMASPAAAVEPVLVGTAEERDSLPESGDPEILPNRDVAREASAVEIVAPAAAAAPASVGASNALPAEARVPYGHSFIEQVWQNAKLVEGALAVGETVSREKTEKILSDCELLALHGRKGWVEQHLVAAVAEIGIAQEEFSERCASLLATMSKRDGQFYFSPGYGGEMMLLRGIRTIAVAHPHRVKGCISAAEEVISAYEKSRDPYYYRLMVSSLVADIGAVSVGEELKRCFDIVYSRPASGAFGAASACIFACQRIRDLCRMGVRDSELGERCLSEIRGVFGRTCHFIVNDFIGKDEKAEWVLQEYVDMLVALGASQSNLAEGVFSYLCDTLPGVEHASPDRNILVRRQLLIAIGRLGAQASNLTLASRCMEYLTAELDKAGMLPGSEGEEISCAAAAGLAHIACKHSQHAKELYEKILAARDHFTSSNKNGRIFAILLDIACSEEGVSSGLTRELFDDMVPHQAGVEGGAVSLSPDQIKILIALCDRDRSLRESFLRLKLVQEGAVSEVQNEAVKSAKERWKIEDTVPLGADFHILEKAFPENPIEFLLCARGIVSRRLSVSRRRELARIISGRAFSGFTDLAQVPRTLDLLGEIGRCDEGIAVACLQHIKHILNAYVASPLRSQPAFTEAGVSIGGREIAIAVFDSLDKIYNSFARSLVVVRGEAAVLAALGKHVESFRFDLEPDMRERFAEMRRKIGTCLALHGNFAVSRLDTYVPAGVQSNIMSFLLPRADT